MQDKSVDREEDREVSLLNKLFKFIVREQSEKGLTWISKQYQIKDTMTWIRILDSLKLLFAILGVTTKYLL